MDNGPLKVGDDCITLYDFYLNGALTVKLPAGSVVKITKVGNVFKRHERYFELLYKALFGDGVVYQGIASDGVGVRGPRHYFMKISPDGDVIKQEKEQSCTV